MTRDEAKFLLQAVRPGGGDAGDPAFAEALALARTDSELREWWEARQNFDRGIAAKLGEIPPPPSLRDGILAQRKIVPFFRRAPVQAWLAAAAVLVLVGIVMHAFFPGPMSPMASGAYTASVLPLLQDDKPALGMMSSDHERVLAWLKERNAPTGDFPSGLAALPSVGCQTFAVHGHTVTLICFALSSGGLAHLFIVDEKALVDPPGNSPEYGSHAGGWSTATWSDGGKSYVLATRAGPEALRALL